MKFISKTVWTLSLVSLFTDTASEMLYPVMPIYLKSIGFSVVLIGILEGIAEATAGFSKAYFGKQSDLSGKRVPFVQIGYLLSAISKPMMVVFIHPLWIFLSRTTDRIGKGVRTGARDAILSDESDPQHKGKVFGFHRSMDTIGAVIGPLFALVYLYFHPQNYKTLFLIALLPGLLSVSLTFLLRDKKVIHPQEKIVKINFFHLFTYWKNSSSEYKKVLIGLIGFSLINSSDVFLLLKATQSGLNTTEVIAVYIFYNLVYALAAYPIGIIADTIGLKKMYISGLILFSLVYVGMGYCQNTILIAILFAFYGIYASATEGISKAWISNISDKKDTATAIGTYSGLQSIATMIASAFAGFLWFQFGSTTLFLFSGCSAFAIAIYFLSMKLNSNSLK